MPSEPGASRSGNSGLVSSAKRRYLKLVIGSVHLWKERKGVRLCGLVRTEETGPLQVIFHQKLTKRQKVK